MTHLKRWLIALVAVFAAIVTLNMQTVQADDSLAKIQQKGTIVMGTSPDYAPYEFLVNKNGKNQVVGMEGSWGQVSHQADEFQLVASGAAIRQG